MGEEEGSMWYEKKKKNIHVILFILFCLNFCFNFLSFFVVIICQKMVGGKRGLKVCTKKTLKNDITHAHARQNVETMNERIKQSNKRNE
jgi:hypothetical protein